MFSCVFQWLFQSATVPTPVITCDDCTSLVASGFWLFLFLSFPSLFFSSILFHFLILFLSFLFFSSSLSFVLFSFVFLSFSYIFLSFLFLSFVLCFAVIFQTTPRGWFPLPFSQDTRRFQWHLTDFLAKIISHSSFVYLQLKRSADQFDPLWHFSISGSKGTRWGNIWCSLYNPMRCITRFFDQRIMTAADSCRRWEPLYCCFYLSSRDKNPFKANADVTFPNI